MNPKEPAMERYAVVKQASQFKFTMLHESFEQAKAEAMRLAELERGGRFFVLKIVGYADLTPRPVTFVEMED